MLLSPAVLYMYPHDSSLCKPADEWVVVYCVFSKCPNAFLSLPHHDFCMQDELHMKENRFFILFLFFWDMTIMIVDVVITNQNERYAGCDFLITVCLFCSCDVENCQVTYCKGHVEIKNDVKAPFNVVSRSPPHIGLLILPFTEYRTPNRNNVYMYCLLPFIGFGQDVCLLFRGTHPRLGKPLQIRCSGFWCSCAYGLWSAISWPGLKRVNCQNCKNNIDHGGCRGDDSVQRLVKGFLFTRQLQWSDRVVWKDGLGRGMIDNMCSTCSE